MQIVGIGSQFWKRVALEQNLPPELCACIKDYLILEQSEAASVYSDCKKRLLKVYGPKPETNVAKAQGIIMTGTQSEAGKQIREHIQRLLLPGHSGEILAGRAASSREEFHGQL